MKPRAVIAIDPTKWRSEICKACHHLLSYNRVKTSAEKAEKVVRLPKKPVIKNNFQASDISGKIEMRYRVIPIKKPPSKFATKIPSDNDEKIGFKITPNNQRLVAPIAAPDAKARMVFITIGT